MLFKAVIYTGLSLIILLSVIAYTNKSLHFLHSTPVFAQDDGGDSGDGTGDGTGDTGDGTGDGTGDTGGPPDDGGPTDGPPAEEAPPEESGTPEQAPNPEDFVGPDEHDMNDYGVMEAQPGVVAEFDAQSVLDAGGEITGTVTQTEAGGATIGSVVNVDRDGDGVFDGWSEVVADPPSEAAGGSAVDVNGDGVTDGYDTNGDGNPDIPLTSGTLPPTAYSNSGCSGASPLVNIWWELPEASDNVILTRSDYVVNGALGNVPSWTPWVDYWAGNSGTYVYYVYYHNPTASLDQSGRGFGAGWSGPGITVMSTPACTPPALYANTGCSGNNTVNNVWWSLPTNSDGIWITRTDLVIDRFAGDIPSWTPWTDWWANTEYTTYGYSVYYHSPVNGPDVSGRGFGAGWSAPSYITVTTGNCAPPISTSIWLPSKDCSGNQPRILVPVSKDAADSAVRYELYKLRGDWSNPVKIKDFLPADFTSNVYYYPDTDVITGYTYIYYVMGYDRFGNGVYSQHAQNDTDDVGLNYYNTPYSGWRIALDCAVPSRPAIYLPVATCNTTSPNITTRVDAAAHATVYQVYRLKKGDSGWTAPWVYNSTQFTGSYYYIDSSVNTGDGYIYFVIAYNQNITDWWNYPSYSYHLLSDLDDDKVNYHTNTADYPSGVKYAPDCQDPTLSFSLNDRFLDPFDTITSDNIGTLKWSVQHANVCTASSTPHDLSWENTPQSKLLAPDQQQNTQVLTNPTTSYASYTLSCTNTFKNNTVSNTVGINVQQINRPFIQTTGGDVHTNKNIDIPGD